ncbi:MAG: DUF4382 domain-containing protein [Nitrospiraceae bacterium]|nr:MAG: DUF4382 domain-containing protein [Nitrospiraceae bacterium]
MILKNSETFSFVYVVFLCIAFSLTSCGSDSDSGVLGNEKTGTGSVAILLTDYPSDDFSKINVTVTKIELLSDESRVSVFSGNKIFNLLDLKNETTLLSVKNNVPAIQFNKIRLTVIQVELIDKNGQPSTKPVTLPGNGKIDLNPRKPFSVRPDEMLTLQLDLDAEKSLKLDENKNRYIFRPVVFIDIIGGVPLEKFLRVKGIVHDIDFTKMKFGLCPDMNDIDSYTGASHDENNNSCCVTVYVSDETSIFGSEEGGRQVPFGYLAEGSSVSVMGFYKTNASINDGSKSCNMGLDAVVVQTGDFLKLTGTIGSEVNPGTNQFDFQVDQDQAVGSENPVTVEILEGTKIFSTLGIALDETAIRVNTKAEIDGKIILNPDPNVPDILKATFISVDTDALTADKLSGVIDNINDSERSFDLLITDKTVCVEVADNVHIFFITEDGTLVSRMIPFEELDKGHVADIYGSSKSASECFAADTIIVFEAK